MNIDKRKTRNRTIADKHSWANKVNAARKKRLWWGEFSESIPYRRQAVNPETDQC